MNNKPSKKEINDLIFCFKVASLNRRIEKLEKYVKRLKEIDEKKIGRINLKLKNKLDK